MKNFWKEPNLILLKKKNNNKKSPFNMEMLVNSQAETVIQKEIKTIVRMEYFNKNHLLSFATLKKFAHSLSLDEVKELSVFIYQLLMALPVVKEENEAILKLIKDSSQTKSEIEKMKTELDRQESQIVSSSTSKETIRAEKSKIQKVTDDVMKQLQETLMLETMRRGF